VQLTLLQIVLFGLGEHITSHAHELLQSTV
jgi:hypothetical protein